MNTKFENKLTMYVIIRDFLLLPASATICAKWAAFAALFARFTALIEEIKATSAKQSEDKTGVTLNKGAVRSALITLMEHISTQGRAYALVVKDYEYLKKIKFMKGELAASSDESLLDKAVTLKDNISLKLTEILQYDLEDSDMDELETLIQQFGDIYSKPQAGTKETEVETDKFTPMFAEGDAILTTVDTLVLSKKKNEPGFVAEYFVKRKIDNQGRRIRSMQLLVLDAETREPLGLAKVIMKRKGGTDMIKSVKRTGTMGGLYYNNLGDGEFECEISKTGYVTQTVTCFVNSGEMTRVEVLMVKR